MSQLLAMLQGLTGDTTPGPRAVILDYPHPAPSAPDGQRQRHPFLDRTLERPRTRKTTASGPQKSRATETTTKTPTEVVRAMPFPHESTRPRLPRVLGRMPSGRGETNPFGRSFASTSSSSGPAAGPSPAPGGVA